MSASSCRAAGGTGAAAAAAATVSPPHAAGVVPSSPERSDSVWCIRGPANNCSSRSHSSSPCASSIITADQSLHAEVVPPAHAASASGSSTSAAAAAAAEMDLSSSDAEPSSPCAHMFGDSASDGDESACKHVLLVVTTLDTFVSYVSIGDQQFCKADLAELLLDNPTLFRWAICLDSHCPSVELLRWREQQQNLHAPAAASIDHLPLGEFKQMLLHLLLRLHQRARESRVAWNVRVSILCKRSLFQPLLMRLPTPAQSSKKSQAAWASTTQAAEEAWSCFQSSAFLRLHVRSNARKTAYRGATRPSSAKSQSAHSARHVTHSSRFAYRFLHELPSDLPVDALYLPSLQWYSELAPQEQLRSALVKLLRDIGPRGLSASLYPPLVWDDLCEQKEIIHAVFADCMIPCKWIALRSLHENDISSLAEQLWNAASSAPLPTGATQNVFMLKAAWHYGKSCVEQLKSTAQGKEATLLELKKRLTRCAQVYQQRTFTMQPYFASLATKEFRIWCVATDSVLPSNMAQLPSAPSLRKRWRIVTGVQSCFVAGSTLLCAEVVSPYDAVTFAVWQFVEDLFLHSLHKAFFDKLLDEGMPGVRIDCFHCEETGRVMLNEITPPQDGIMFTPKHGLPMIKGVMHALADGLFAELA